MRLSRNLAWLAVAATLSLSPVLGCSGDGDAAGAGGDPGSSGGGESDPPPATPVLPEEPGDDDLPDTATDAGSNGAGDAGGAELGRDGGARDAAPPPSRPPGQVVYVNFDGPTIKACATCSSAPTDESLVISEYFGRTSLDFAPYTNAAAKTAIVNHLTQFFAGYNVTFTTTRPAQPPYTMVVITPTTARNHGIAPLDCRNTNKNDIAFVFRTGTYSAKFIAQEAAHELGHTFGLAHVLGNDQIMQYASSGDRFGVATYDTGHPSGKCFSGSTQDAPALLVTALGKK